jgi:aspartyl-tRNA(Asn)/glutamyl-tRNA(Gln) amidotransferase subunit B
MAGDMKYIPTIGLEVHMELNTQTKMFCHCPNESGDLKPNTNVCPICLGHPGTMPVANKEAIRSIIKLGMALGGKIADIAIFDRKSYFYPDLPKGYQISQYEHPFVEGGELAGVKLTRVHLEEDAGKLMHATDGASLVDYNRASVPLMELVTEPVISSGDEAQKFAKELQLILRYLGICNADMEKGEMRLEANISVRPEGTDKLGTKVEVKNLNSFRSLTDAINFEIKRQSAALDKGERIIQETRGWNQVKSETYSQRSKEQAHDYRYHPEPDLPPIDLTDKSFIDLDEVRLSVPELPAEKRARFVSEFGLPEAQVSDLTEDRYLADYFEKTVSEVLEEAMEMSEEDKKKAVTLSANYILADMRGLMNEMNVTDMDAVKITPENMADLAVLIVKGDVTSRMAKDLLRDMFESGLDPRAIIEKKGIKQVTDEGPILEAIKAVMEANPNAVADFKKGKENALQFMIGQTMAKLKGQGNPGVVKKVLEENL